MGVVPY